MVIRKIGVGSAARIAGALYAVIGLVGGCFIALFSMISAGLMGAADNNLPSWIAPMFGIGAVVVAPIFYGLMGLVVGAVGALVYNLVAGMAGGLEIEVQ
jgi:hypothetical protein